MVTVAGEFLLTNVHIICLVILSYETWHSHTLICQDYLSVNLKH